MLVTFDYTFTFFTGTCCSQYNPENNLKHKLKVKSCDEKRDFKTTSATRANKLGIKNVIIKKTASKITKNALLLGKDQSFSADAKIRKYFLRYFLQLINTYTVRLFLFLSHVQYTHANFSIFIFRLQKS